MRKCILCQSEVNFFGQNNGYNIYRCPDCRLGFTEKLQSQQADYHRDETYIEEEVLFKNIFLKRVNIITKFSKAGLALEIGCSTGLMLSLLKNRGWQVVGVEISQKAAKAAESRGIKILNQPFEEIKLKSGYDLVIFNHTLEHLENPIEAVKKAKLILKPGGLIYIDLPNFGSLSAKLLGTNWPLLLPNEHKWHFTLKALSLLLNNLNFKVVNVHRDSGVWDYNNPLLGIWNSLTSFKKRFFIEVFTLVPSLVISKLGLGSDLMIIAKKR